MLEIFVTEAEGYLADIQAYQDNFPRGGEVTEGRSMWIDGRDYAIEYIEYFTKEYRPQGLTTPYQDIAKFTKVYQV